MAPEERAKQRMIEDLNITEEEYERDKENIENTVTFASISFNYALSDFIELLLKSFDQTLLKIKKRCDK